MQLLCVSVGSGGSDGVVTVVATVVTVAQCDDSGATVV